MTKTYAQVMKQVKALTREAEKLKQKEVDDVVARIREAVDAYGLTAADLGFSNGRGRGKVVATKKRATKGSKSKSGRVVKYRDDQGNTWVGRGPRPQWLRDALATGRQLQDFAV